MNVIVADKISNSREIISYHLERIKGVEVLGTFEDFKFEFADISQLDLIIFDITMGSSDDILEKIKNLKQKKPELNFIATSYEINSELVAKTLKDGHVRDFLLKPMVPSVFEASIRKILDEKKAMVQNAKTLCFFSNKAGTGKTSIATNVAYEIAQKTQQKVCLLDLTSNDDDIATFLDIKLKYDIDYIISKLETSNKELFLSLTNRYKKTSLYIVSFKEEFGKSTKLNQKIISRIINSLKNIFDWIIIDTPSPLNENSISIFNSCDLIFLVALLSLSSVRHCQKCIELFDKMDYNSDKIKLIINRYIENSDISIIDIEKILQKKVFDKIPNNYLTLVDAINSGCPVAQTNIQSNIAKAYKKIANKITNIDFSSIEEINKIKFNHGIFNLLRRMGE